MTTENTPAAGVVTPAVTDTSVQKTETKTAAAPDSESVTLNRNAFNERIAQAKTAASNEAQAALLKELGVANIEEAKAIAAAAKAAADANKSAEQRALESKTALDAKTIEANRLTEMAARMALGAMSSLTEEQKAAVKAAAGDDPAKQLEIIEAFKPTWAKAAAAQTTTEEVTTAPSANAPKGVVPGSSAPRAVYEQTRETNPFAAASFGLSNPAVYDPK